MKNFLLGALAFAGGVYISKEVSCYLLVKYKKEVREFVMEKVVDYFFTDEDGNDIDENEVLMMAINAYLKKKGAK